MKKLLILMLLIANSELLPAQNAPIEKELRDLEEKERIAMLNRDTTTMLKLWATDITCNTPVNRITYSSKELIDLINKGIFNFTSFERKIENIFLKENIAFIMGNETVVPTNNSPRAGQTIKRRYTNIWIKQNGIWKLTARHANEICGS